MKKMTQLQLQGGSCERKMGDSLGFPFSGREGAEKSPHKPAEALWCDIGDLLRATFEDGDLCGLGDRSVAPAELTQSWAKPFPRD